MNVYKAHLFREVGKPIKKLDIMNPTRLIAGHQFLSIHLLILVKMQLLRSCWVIRRAAYDEDRTKASTNIKCVAVPSRKFQSHQRHHSPPQKLN